METFVIPSCILLGLTSTNYLFVLVGPNQYYSHCETVSSKRGGITPSFQLLPRMMLTILTTRTDGRRMLSSQSASSLEPLQELNSPQPVLLQSVPFPCAGSLGLPLLGFMLLPSLPVCLHITALLWSLLMASCRLEPSEHLISWALF